MRAIAADQIFTLEVVLSGSEGEPTPQRLSFPAPGREGYVIGRTDVTSSYLPDIDLAAFGGQQHGVSRRHAVLVRHQGAVCVVDLMSMNGTFINEERITAGQAYLLQQGDILRLANLRLRITVE